MTHSWVHRSLAVGAAGALAVTLAPAASAAPPPTVPVPVAEHLAGPLTFDVEPNGGLYVGQAFAGALTHVSKKGVPTDLYGPTGVDLTAVSVHKGVVTWAETAFDETGMVQLSAVLKQRAPNGTVRELTDLFDYEDDHNPDGDVTYGFQGLDEACAAMLPPFLLPYTGIVESHPYGSVTVGGDLYVADAAANAVLRVDADGDVSTVAVLPGTEVLVTADMAAAVGVPDCVAGHVMVLESVPTDVEIGKNGMLYVSTLPGGPEDGSLGANGAVYVVDPGTGEVTRLADGFAGATNVAVAPNGTVYVAELFGDRVSAISRRGTVTTVANLTMPAGIEWQSGRLYVSTNVFGDGSIVSFKAR